MTSLRKLGWIVGWGVLVAASRGTFAADGDKQTIDDLEKALNAGTPAATPKSETTPAADDAALKAAAAEGTAAGEKEAAAPTPPPADTLDKESMFTDEPDVVIDEPAEPKGSAPQDIEALEKSLRDGTALESSDPLFEPTEPGGTLKPSDRFSRVPIRPRMSDSNWRRWAGPMLEKTYKVRRRDTLWGISERFFGNPYLWPKVWQLNAQIANPHVIDPGVELSFLPGNPNSAPALAFKRFPGKTTEEMPILSTRHKLSLMETLDETLQAQILSTHPPFQSFVFDQAPSSIARVPKPENPIRMFHDEGDGFMLPGVADGTYSIIRVRPVKNKFYAAYRVKWLGTIRVQAKRATLVKAFSEISEGDLITSKTFTMSPLALHEQRLGSEERDNTQLMAVQEGYETLASENMLIGVRFAGIDRGPRIGALMTLSHGANQVATILLVDRDQRMGTAWVVQSVRELDLGSDKID